MSIMPFTGSGTVGTPDLAAGATTFSSLPIHVRRRLLKRQKNEHEDQIQVKQSSVAGNVGVIIFFLGWFVFLFFSADGNQWTDERFRWYLGITVVIAIVLGANMVSVTRWSRSSLKSYFYLTPLYLLKTQYDDITFHPLWTLEDVSVTHHHNEGSYTSSTVNLKIAGHRVELSMSSRGEVDLFFERIQLYDERLQAAYKDQDSNYFITHNDFHGVPRTESLNATHVNFLRNTAIYITCAMVSLCGLYAAQHSNIEYARERWVRHPTPPDPAETPPQPTPRSPSHPTQPLPFSGQVRSFNNEPRVAPFELKAAKGSHFLVKLVNAYTSSDVLTVFVRSGTTVNIEAPLGTFEVRYASGESWYGHEFLFGPNTSYSKADRTFTFERTGNQIQGFTITLYRVAFGNLSTSQIDPREF